MKEKKNTYSSKCFSSFEVYFKTSSYSPKLVFIKEILKSVSDFINNSKWSLFLSNGSISCFAF